LAFLNSTSDAKKHQKAMNNKFWISFAWVLTLTMPVLLAQPGGGGPPPIATSVPIDGGITWLLVAGAAYGAKKIYDYNKKQDPESNA
jgi:hypothetical protein